MLIDYIIICLPRIESGDVDIISFIRVIFEDNTSVLGDVFNGLHCQVLHLLGYWGKTRTIWKVKKYEKIVWLPGKLNPKFLTSVKRAAQKKEHTINIFGQFFIMQVLQYSVLGLRSCNCWTHSCLLLTWILLLL